ncbi:1-acyl-sn-glycerol-3-phosphate acyltransferase [Timonella sp. A28]|uniref:1-acyl-sn-glycerol-3-phosphate acyltransferase n=1 Tax=Timonella sp. A28 TaxID=3442640 RepID=UPI003EBC6155
MSGGIRRSIAKVGWKISKWEHVSTVVPEPGKPSILIGAPHTSNWDFILMLGIAWELGIKVRFLGKDSLFKFPLGILMRALGGIPVDRKRPYGLVEDLVKQAKSDDSFVLVVTPEGTRGTGKYWKSGFYRIAMQTGVPITLGYVDRDTMTSGLGATFTPTGDVHADMDFVRDFYKDKSGLKPHLRTEPRLREEDREARS